MSTVDETTTKRVGHSSPKTLLFQQHLQAIISEALGQRVSVAKAWEIYKSFMLGSFQFVAKMEAESKPVSKEKDDNGNVTKVVTANIRHFPLSGIGTYRIVEAPPSGARAGYAEDGSPIPGMKQQPFTPRIRFKPSNRILDQVYALLGLEEPKSPIKMLGLFSENYVDSAASKEDTEAAPKAVTPKKEKAPVESEKPADSKPKPSTAKAKTKATDTEKTPKAKTPKAKTPKAKAKPEDEEVTLAEPDIDEAPLAEDEDDVDNLDLNLDLDALDDDI